MKATIKREISPDGKKGFFIVYANDDSVIASRSYVLGSPDDSIWNEAKNYNEAMAIALKIEAAKNMEALNQTSIVYQTPD
jgi:hypothetical protein